MGRKIRSIQKCMEELIQIVHERRKYDKGLLDYVVQVRLHILTIITVFYLFLSKVLLDFMFT